MYRLYCHDPLQFMQYTILPAIGYTISRYGSCAVIHPAALSLSHSVTQL